MFLRNISAVYSSAYSAETVYSAKCNFGRNAETPLFRQKHPYFGRIWVISAETMLFWWYTSSPFDCCHIYYLVVSIIPQFCQFLYCLEDVIFSRILDMMQSSGLQKRPWNALHSTFLGHSGGPRTASYPGSLGKRWSLGPIFFFTALPYMPI